jgi:phosphoribosylformylglycinamidine synthase
MTGNAISRKRGRRQFNEEAGIVLEVLVEATKPAMEAFSARGVSCIEIGTSSTGGDSNKIAVGPCIDEKMTVLRDLWEETSFQLEHRQRNPECVAQEEVGLKLRKAPEWKLTYLPEPTDADELTEGAQGCHHSSGGE